MSHRIALATTRQLDVLDADEESLLAHLPEAVVVPWEDEEVDWAAFDAVILRSTWNYTDHLDEFLTWARKVDQVTRLFNPLSVVEWNTDKRYLRDLAQAGIPVVPTEFFATGEDVTGLALDGRKVVKPTVGAGSKGAKLFNDDPAAARAHLAALHADGRVAMVQPYLDQVDAQGETALIFVGGEFSHAARKAAILSREMSWSTGIYADEKVVGVLPSAQELELAESIISSLAALVPGGGDLAYARVDLLPTATGPVVLELELTEPSLFLELGEGAAERAASAFRSLLA